MAANERLNQWLRDAHAMETQAEQLLAGQQRRTDNHPVFSARLEQHIGIAKMKRERLERCLERRGTSASTLKDTAARITATAQNFSGYFMEDEVVKGALAIYTFEQMAVASYLILEAAAKADDDEQTALECAQSRSEDEELCAWLKGHLGEVAVMHLQD